MVRIVQYLCPERHCIVAAAYEEGIGSFEEAKEMLTEGMKLLGCNPWCGLCGSRDLKFEEQVTKFETMEEAAPTLAELQIANIASMVRADSTGTSYDAKQRKNN